ncbi:hypothetical protein HIM_05098 [Hirsutella minnesotensis 3608]|uniref:Palmitoyltransferase n=1 Tax=Hirsutella minnesotensis 3608 TaxID=1043627 RepID=A0A0F7ZPK0_9HYPO|nr:hypothetical protein HIM_05098 [Hirsutella minnesotensis 3608]
MRPGTSNRAATRWTIRIIPFFIVAIFGVGTFAVVSRLCVEYLYRQRGNLGVAAALLALYFVFLILTVASYLRVFLTIQLDPGLVPLIHGPRADNHKPGYKKGRGRDVEANPWVPPDSDPDSPGLEAFYSKDVFVCEADGRPKWCSDCRQWKPDRAHHSSEVERCVRKMDHLCPWVGGMVSETSFNFFFHFTFYTTCLCSISIAAGAYCLQQQNSQGSPVDGWVIAVIVLAALFGFFTFAMTLTALRFIFTNITNIDILRKSQVFFLAVRIPRETPPSSSYSTIVYPLQTRPVRELANGSVMNAPRSREMDRDYRASRKFAILRTEPRENPWDLGLWRNWKSVMGNSVIEWLLPIRRSPCCNHESMESDYELGPLLADLKKRFGLPELNSERGSVVEMRDTAMPVW